MNKPNATVRWPKKKAKFKLQFRLTNLQTTKIVHLFGFFTLLQHTLAHNYWITGKAFWTDEKWRNTDGNGWIGQTTDSRCPAKRRKIMGKMKKTIAWRWNKFIKKKNQKRRAQETGVSDCLLIASRNNWNLKVKALFKKRNLTLTRTSLCPQCTRFVFHCSVNHTSIDEGGDLVHLFTRTCV